MGHGGQSRHIRRGFGFVAVGLLAGASLVACGAAPGAADRPTTAASLRIVSPQPGQATGPDLDVRLELRRAHVVAGAGRSGDPASDAGHIHVWLDGDPVVMAYGLDQPLHGLTPGEHWLRAEFVATDHLPFRNDVSESVTFTVR